MLQKQNLLTLYDDKVKDLVKKLLVLDGDSERYLQSWFFFFFFSIVKKQEHIYFSIQFLMQAHASYVIQVHLGSV